jgi:HlyD family secretion protein
MSLRLSGTKLLFALAGLGCVVAIAAAVVMNERPKPQSPVFNPASDPYPQGIYANGIVESDQPSGSNINLYPEIAGTVVEVPVRQGQAVRRGDVLVRFDDRVQRATAEQQRAQAQAARAMLDELNAQPRPENLYVAQAQLVAAEASAKQTKDTYDKQKRAFELDPRAVSRDALDTAENAWRVAQANRATAQRNLELTRAGAWVFDVRNQQAQYDALLKSYQASTTLLEKYTVRAPADGVVMQIKASVGSYVNPQGVYDTYTQGSNAPAVVLSRASAYLNVRCYVDEILIPRLPPRDRIKGQMSVRGTDIRVPLEFVDMEPYVSPKIQLSDQRLERVDVRVLPVIFRFGNNASLKLFPGQLVDVYIGQ